MIGHKSGLGKSLFIGSSLIRIRVHIACFHEKEWSEVIGTLRNSYAFISLKRNSDSSVGAEKKHNHRTNKENN